MLFQKRQDFITNASLNDLALGASVKVEITREFPIEAIFIKLSGTPTATMATANPDALLNLLRRVNLTVADGVRTRSVVECTGGALLEWAQNVMGNLDRNTSKKIGNNSTDAFELTYPIYCAHPQMIDPLGSMLLLPVHKYPTNPILTIELATQAQMDVNATPTFAIAAGVDVEIIVVRRQVTLAKWNYIDWELTELEQLFAASGDEQKIELPVPGSYTGQLYRGYTSTSARGDIANSSNPVWRIETLGVVFRRFKMTHLQYENDVSKVVTGDTAGAVSNTFTGSFYNDFLTDKSGQDTGELGSVLDANIPLASGAKIFLVGNITGGAGVKLRLLNHRMFGNLSALKMK